MEPEVAPKKFLQLSEKLPIDAEDIHNLLDTVWTARLQSPKKSDTVAPHIEQASHKHVGVTPFPSKMRAIRDAITGNPLAPYRRLHQLTEAPVDTAEPQTASPTVHLFAEIGFLSEVNRPYRDALSILAAWQPTDAPVNLVMHPVDNTLTTMALRDPLPAVQFTPEMTLADKLKIMQQLLQQARDTQPKYYLQPDAMYSLREQKWSLEMAEQIKKIYDQAADTSPLCVYLHDDLPLQNNETVIMDSVSSSAPCVRLENNKNALKTDIITFELKQ